MSGITVHRGAVGSSTLDINGLTAADPAFADALPIYDASAAANRKITVEELGGFLLPIVAGGRLTALTATGVPTTDQTAVTVLYYTPGQTDWGGHDRISLFDGTRWNERIFAELSLKATDSAQTGTRISAAATLTGLTDTSQLVRGMHCDGTGMHASAQIASIDSATSLTMTQNASSSGSSVVTFSLEASKLYDVFAIDSGGSAKLQFGGAWSSDTARADAIGLQDSIIMNNAAINAADSNTIAAKRGRLLGTIRTTTTIGQTEDSRSSRLIANVYNTVTRIAYCNDSTDSWTYSTDTYREINGGSTLGTGRVGILCPLASWDVKAECRHNASGTLGNRRGTGVGIDSTTVNSAQAMTESSAASAHIVGAEYSGYPGIGYHVLSFLERASAATTTWYGDGGLTLLKTGMIVRLLA